MNVEVAQAVNIGPFSVGLPFCREVNKLGAILNSYTIVQWPVAGVPGFTFGLLQNNSPLMDFCQYLIQLEQLDTESAIFLTANELNNLTGQKWNEHLNFMSNTWSLSKSVYDFENGKVRKASLESPAVHRRMNNTIREYSRLYGNNEIQTRQEREADMNRFASVVHRRAILQEAMSCPDTSDNVDYSRIYQKDVQPWELRARDAKYDLDFFKSQMLRMSSKFPRNQAEQKQFIEQLEKLDTQGITYNVDSSKSINDKTVKRYNESGIVKTKEESIKRKYQTWKVSTSPELFRDIKDNWQEKWDQWVQREFLSRGSRGLLDDPKARVEREFVNLTYECNPYRLMQGIDQTNANYEKLKEERVTKCKENVKVNQKKAGNLLLYYIDEYQRTLYTYKEANSKIWTLESKYLGRNRMVKLEDAAEGYQQEQVQCSEVLQPAEMQKIGIKQQAVNNEYTEIIAQEAIKQNVLMEEQQKARQKEDEKRQRRIDYSKRVNGETTNDLNQSTTVPAQIKGGF